jgi:hypothetical protein
MRSQDIAKEEGWIEDQKPYGRHEGDISIFRSVRRILSAGQKQILLLLIVMLSAASGPLCVYVQPAVI